MRSVSETRRMLGSAGMVCVPRIGALGAFSP